MIKCIVCDLDGTLIKQDDTMPESNARAIRELVSQGIEFIIATGREYNMVVEILEDNQIECDLVLNNGCEYRSKDRKEIYPMDPDEFVKIVRILQEYDYAIEIFTEKGLYGLKDADAFWDQHYKMLRKALSYGAVIPEKTFTVKEKFLREFHYVKCAEDVLKEATPLKIDARHQGDDSLHTVRTRLKIIQNLNISSSHDQNIEITGTISDKGRLLAKITAEKGYQYDEVAVFGDGENDLPMMKQFKYSICPSNAKEAVKEVSFYTTKAHCDEGAVVEGIEKLREMGLIK